MAQRKPILLLAATLVVASVAGSARAAIPSRTDAGATLSVSLQLRDPCSASPAPLIQVPGTGTRIALGCSDGPAPQVQACANPDASALDCAVDAMAVPTARPSVSGGGDAPFVVRYSGAPSPALGGGATLTLSVVY